MTVLIESTQLILARGVAEADDILNNFLGTMIGYGIYVLFREITAAAKRKRFSVLKMAAAQIPLAAIVLVFVGIFIMYDRQELGNLEIGLSSRIDMSDVQMTTTENYSSQPGNRQQSIKFLYIRKKRQERLPIIFSLHWGRHWMSPGQICMMKRLSIIVQSRILCGLTTQAGQ